MYHIYQDELLSYNFIQISTVTFLLKNLDVQ